MDEMLLVLRAVETRNIYVLTAFATSCICHEMACPYRSRLCFGSSA
jgi:hypothetical protein